MKNRYTGSGDVEITHVRLSAEEIDMLRGIVKFYLANQSFPTDRVLWLEVNRLYEKL